MSKRLPDSTAKESPPIQCQVHRSGLLKPGVTRADNGHSSTRAPSSRWSQHNHFPGHCTPKAGPGKRVVYVENNRRVHRRSISKEQKSASRKENTQRDKYNSNRHNRSDMRTRLRWMLRGREFITRLFFLAWSPPALVPVRCRRCKFTGVMAKPEEEQEVVWCVKGLLCSVDAGYVLWSEIFGGKSTGSSPHWSCSRLQTAGGPRKGGMGLGCYKNRRSDVEEHQSTTHSPVPRSARGGKSYHLISIALLKVQCLRPFLCYSMNSNVAKVRFCFLYLITIDGAIIIDKPFASRCLYLALLWSVICD